MKEKSLAQKIKDKRREIYDKSCVLMERRLKQAEWAADNAVGERDLTTAQGELIDLMMELNAKAN